jgi:hypothetical protein
MGAYKRKKPNFNNKDSQKIKKYYIYKYFKSLRVIIKTKNWIFLSKIKILFLNQDSSKTKFLGIINNQVSGNSKNK